MLSRRKFAGMAGVGLLMWPRVGRTSATGLVAGTVTVTRGPKDRPVRDHSGVVVYLEGLEGSLPTGESHEIRQIDKRFVPAVSVVTVGTTLTFPNDDTIYHNVFSNSPSAKFDLGRYKRGATRSVRLKKPGQVEVYCNIHESMRATVLVLETVYYDQTDRRGAFSIPDVPEGTHRFVVWQRDAKPLHGRVTVMAGAPAHLELEIREGRPKRHRKKTGHAHGYG
jgi:plastocyanin